MFARWRQENLFKYMGAHHGLDHLVSYGAETADADTRIPNPQRKRLDREIAARRKDLAALKPLPKHVTVAEAGATREVMRLEHKAIVDRIKISAYNAEEWLLDRLIRHYPNPDDVRDLLR